MHFLPKNISLQEVHFEGGNNSNVECCFFNKILKICTDHRMQYAIQDIYRKFTSSNYRFYNRPGLGGVLVSADACMQVVQGSNPTDGWKVTGSANSYILKVETFQILNYKLFNKITYRFAVFLQQLELLGSTCSSKIQSSSNTSM